MKIMVTKTMVSKHYKEHRNKRDEFIKECLNNDGRMVDGFVIDRGHRHGLEVHSITENGIILIHNLKSGKLVTKLVARPQQIKRYYESTGREKPYDYENILELAKWHHILGFNV